MGKDPAPTLTRVIFACDESCAKGYADRDERFPGEVGVFAGILMPEEVMVERIPLFQALVTKYARADGKLHIAELDQETQQKLRADAYEAVRQSNLPCFWYAIHVAGLHGWYLHTQQIMARAAAASRQSRVKKGSPRSSPPLLHLELFKGLYGHLIAFLEERGRKELHIEIWTDQIDSPIVKQFRTTAKELLSLDPVVKKITGFDTVTKKLVGGEVRAQLRLPSELDIQAVVRSLSVNPIRQGDGLVLAADVLANSLTHLFHNRNDNERYGPLNRPEAIASHPLADYLAAFHDWGTSDLVGDGLYRHPKMSGEAD